jgi:excisionase family DNA binding protein
MSFADATLTPAEAAAGAGVDPRTVRRFADRGDLPAIRLTRRSPRRFLERDVRALLERIGDYVGHSSTYMTDR